jgi:phosphoglycerate-specific signal transduction histidine kinase
MNEVKISELKKEISELKIQLTEEKSWLKQYFGWHEKQEVLLKEQEATLKEQEKELGYYRWYEQHIEQHFPDTFYDMRNGNEYRTRVGCRAQYEKEMELKKTPLL